MGSSDSRPYCATVLAPRSPQPAKLTMIQGWFMNSVMVILWVGSVFSRFRISIFTVG